MSPASGRFLLIALASGQPWRADAFGAPSKKNATGTCRIWDICCNRLAPMRLHLLEGEAECGTQLFLAHCKQHVIDGPD